MSSWLDQAKPIAGADAYEQATFIPEAQNCVTDPVTGELVDLEDADSLIESLERVKEQIAKLSDYRRYVEDELVSRTPDQDRTERVVGMRRTVRVERPAPDYEPASLKRLWEKHHDDNPREVEELLRVSAVAVNRSPLKKLLKADIQNPISKYLVQAISAAERPAGRAKVTIER